MEKIDANLSFGNAVISLNKSEQLINEAYILFRKTLLDAMTINDTQTMTDSKKWIDKIKKIQKIYKE